MARIRTLLAHPRGTWAMACVAFLLTVPSLGVGLALDDWFHRGRMLGVGPFPRMDYPVLEFFAMVPRHGAYAEALRPFLAWWQAPEIEITFFRPLSSATHVLDMLLWPDRIPLHHLHNVVWYALAVFVVALAIRRCSRSPAVAGLAAWMFCLEDAHGMPAGWIANRNALVALVFGGLALTLHVAWRTSEDRRRRTALAMASWASMALGLLAGESSLGAFAYIVAWEMWIGRGGWKERLRSLVPVAMVVAAWRLLYLALGYRTHGSGLYLDPIRNPMDFFRAALERAPTLLLAQWFQVPVDLALAVPRFLQLTLTGVGLLGLTLLLVLFWDTLKRSAEARFWATGMALALVPTCATFPMDRLLTFTGIGAFALLATHVERTGWLGVPATGQASRWARRGTGGLLFLHLGLAGVLLPIRTLSPSFLFASVERTASHVPEEDVSGETWVFVNGFDLFNMYVPIIRPLRGESTPAGVETLACSLVNVRVFRPDEKTLEIQPEGGFLVRDIERLVRSDRIPFARGDRIQRGRMEVEVLEVTEDHRPAQVRFRFDVPLEDPSLRWFESVGLETRPFQPPALGKTLILRGAEKMLLESLG